MEIIIVVIINLGITKKQNKKNGHVGMLCNPALAYIYEFAPNK